LNGESRRSLALAVVSFAIGAVIVAVLGNSKTRAKIAEHGKKAAERSRKLLTRAEM
jgi:hypothetical protein